MATQSFAKGSRLLNPDDYKGVFDHTHFKVSCRYFLILARYSHQPKTRLGLIVAKKHIRSAVQRNRLKRLARNSFRTLDPLPHHLDLIVLVRRDAGKINNQQVFDSLTTLWSDVELQCRRKGNKSRPPD